MMNKKIMTVAVSAAVLLMTGCGSDSKKSAVASSSVAMSSSSVAMSSSSAAMSSSAAASSSQAAVVLPDAVTCVGAVCTLKGVLDKDFTLTADKTWLLDGTVLVGKGNAELTSQSAIDAVKAAGVTLTVEPGVEVKGKEGSTLIITRGSKLHAVGTKEKPIGFSSVDENYDGYSEWKGLVIQGFAPYYLPKNKGGGICSANGAWCNIDGEGGTEVGKFGGTDKADNSGMLKYVRIAETGFVASQGSEINGLTLMGVGYGTKLDYIQLHNSGDDAIEWFGGTVNLTHAVLTNTDDDDIDFDTGYQGNIQHVLVRKHPTQDKPKGSNDPRGIEANSDASKSEQVPETMATLANITIVGSNLVNVKLNVTKDGVTTQSNQQGMRLRGEVKTHIWNSAVSDFETCIQVDDGMNNFHNFLGACTGSFLIDKSAGNSYMADVVTQKPDATKLGFNANWALTEASAKLGSPVAAIAAVNNGSGFTFELTDYIGAVDPAATEAWWAGWTIPGSLDK